MHILPAVLSFLLRFYLSLTLSAPGHLHTLIFYSFQGFLKPVWQGPGLFQGKSASPKALDSSESAFFRAHTQYSSAMR